MRSGPVRLTTVSLIAALSTWAPMALSAQASAELRPGSRVRFAVRDSLRQAPLRPATQLLIGTLERVGGDTLFVAVPSTGGTLSVARADARQLSVSLGVPNRLESAVRHGVESAVALALAFFVIRRSNDDDSFRSPGEAAAIGAGIGFGIGAVLGAVSPSERWRRVRGR